MDAPALSLADSLKILLVCWRNEKGAPVVLPPPVAALMALKPHVQDVSLRFAEMQEAETGRRELLRLSIQELEVHRVKYVYTDFLRVRLQKIDTNPHYYAAHPENLFPEERQYAASLADVFANHFARLLLHQLPPPYNEAPDLGAAALVEPALAKHVLVEVLADRAVVCGGDAGQFSLEPQRRYVVCFKDVRAALADNLVRII